MVFLEALDGLVPKETLVKLFHRLDLKEKRVTQDSQAQQAVQV